MFKRRERLLDEYLPLVSHISDRVVLLNDGSVFCMLAVEGIAWETADADDIMLWHAHYNMLLRNIATDGLVIGTYQCRGMASPSVYPKGVFRNQFAAELNDRYRDQLFSNDLYDNRLYLTFSLRPLRPMGDMVAEQVAKRAKADPETPEARLQRLEEICDVAIERLAAYRPRFLRAVRRGNAIFSEIAEGLVFAVTGRARSIGLTTGRMSRAMFSERIIVGRETIEFRAPDTSTYAAMFGMREYPASTWPGMFAALSNSPYCGTLFQSFRFLRKDEAEKVMTRKQNFMLGAEDKAFSQIDQLIGPGGALDQLMSNEFVLGDHSLSLIAFAETVPALKRVVSKAWDDLADGGAVVAREGMALEAALFSLIPGNDKYRPRPGFISSRNFAAMAPLHNYPAGSDKGHWGGPIAMLRTAAGTPYRFHWHPPGSDVGNTLIIGETGSGKTILTGFMLAMTSGRARVIALDYKRGWEMLIRDMAGSYAALGEGRPHLAPLKGLDPTPRNLLFLNELLRGCIGRELADDEERLLALGISMTMTLPPEKRGLSEVRAFLGSDPGSAGMALDKWCWGNELGWVIDAPRDAIRVDGNLHGFDTTTLIENPRARAAALSYLFHRIDLELNGDPILIAADEQWRALTDDSFRPMISRQMRTIRSKNGVFAFVTQGVGEIIETGISRVLVEQCPTQILLPVERATKSDYIDGLKRTEGEWEAFRALRKGSGMFLLCQGNQSAVVHLPLHGMEDEIATLSARESTLKVLDKVISEVGDDNPRHLISEVHRRRKELA